MRGTAEQRSLGLERPSVDSLRGWRVAGGPERGGGENRGSCSPTILDPQALCRRRVLSMVPRRLPSPALPSGVPWHRPSPLVVGREDAPTGGVVAVLGLPGPGGAAALVLAVGGRGRHGGCPGGCAAEVPGSATGCSGVSRGARPGCINQGGAAAGSPRVAQAQTGARGVGVDMGGASF